MRALRHSNLFLGLLCLLLIAARISGAHWHLCFDHNEPPLMMHVGDIDLHDEGNTSNNHQDTDLKLVDDGLTKSLSAGLNIPVVLSFIVLLWLLPLHKQSVPRSDYRTPFFSSDLRPLHAPPRAPPF